MADNEFRDVFFSDSKDEDFAGFEQIDLNEAEIDGLVDVNNVELDDIDLREIVEEIDREERDAFHEAYEHDWLQNFVEIPGPRHIDAETTPYEIFSHFFHNDILELLVNQTNLYYDQYIIAKGGLETFSAHSRVRAWIPVTLPEMKAFIAIILFQGLVRMPNYDMYWSTHHLINLKSLSSYMTRDRFLNILSFLHACDNSVEPPRDSPDYDPSYKISRISQLLIAKWREFYHPNREVSVDETLVPFKGRTKFLQYIPSKPHKWGLKVWTLADSKSGYVWNWQLYTGKKNHEHGMGATHAIVMTLCEPLLNLGHHLYCDNYFTSPALFDDLANHQTGACGTLRVNRNGVPRQRVTSNNDIVNWIQKVEDASNRAAEQVFGTQYTSGRSKGKAVAKATREYMQDDEQAYSEAQELLSQWMEEKVHLQTHLEPDIDCNYQDDDWQRYEIESDVKKQWDKMLANNYDEYGLAFTEDPREKYGDLYNFNEEDAVSSVMKNMLNKQVVKKEFKKDLGLDKWGQQVDPKQKMELRRQQVKENREKREQELRRKREEDQRKKETVHRAKQMVIQEERNKELQSKKEEMAIRKEMAKLRKEMQEDRKKVEEKRAIEKQRKEEAMFAAKVKVAWETQEEEMKTLEDQRKEEEKHRILAQRLQELEKREAANNLKILHRHFSAWYNVVLERRLKVGKAHAMYDWKLLLRAWNAWRGYVRKQRLNRDQHKYQQDVIHTQRNQQTAEKHHRIMTLRKYLLAWQIWVRSEQDKRELEKAQASTRNKMASLLEAAASGKLQNQLESQPSTERSTHRSRSATLRSNISSVREKNISSSDKIDALFEQTRKIPNVMDSVSTDRSNMATPSGLPTDHINSRIPHEPWQVTRKHLNLTTEEMANMMAGEPSCSPEEMNAKILKKYGRQPWHKQEVSSYEHRHATQKKILEDQKRQIREQQRMIEELQFKSTHMELQKQLVEQKLTLQNIADQIEQKSDNQLNTESDQIKEKCAKSTVKNKQGGASKTITVAKQLERTKSSPDVTNRNNNYGIIETSRTNLSTARPESARTNLSKNSSYTSTASEKTKYLQVLDRMNERAAERARLKAERDEKRRLAEEERLKKLEEEAVLTKQKEEDEKRAKIEAFRERKRQEKQRELERQMKDEKLRQQIELADDHYRKSILKYRGLLPFKKLVHMARESEQTADLQYNNTLSRKVLLAWNTHVKDQWREKEALADEMSKFLAIKHCFQSWRLYKHHTIIQEHKAKRYYDTGIKSKILQVWRDYANEERVASWEKERKAREHYTRLLLKRHFKAWQKLPEEIVREKEREKRRCELREKVAALLPDFEPTISVNESTDFS